MRTPTNTTAKAHRAPVSKTPKNKADMRPASWWRRTYALLIDTVLGLLFVAPTLLTYQWMTNTMALRPRPALDSNGQMQSSLLDPNMPALVMTGTHPASLASQYAVMAATLLFIVFTAVNTLVLPGKVGWSIGKRAAKVRLISTNMLSPRYGGPIGFVRVLVRSVAHIADAFGLGYFRPLWKKDHQTWADMVCKTSVVMAEEKTPTDLWTETSVGRRRFNRFGLVLLTVIAVGAPFAYEVQHLVNGVLVSPPAISAAGWEHNAQTLSTHDGKVTIRVPADWYIAHELTLDNTGGTGYGLAVQSMNPFASMAPAATLTAIVYTKGGAAVQLAADIQSARANKTCQINNRVIPHPKDPFGITGTLWVCNNALEYIKETPAGSMLVTLNMSGNTELQTMKPILSSITAK